MKEYDGELCLEDKQDLACLGYIYTSKRENRQKAELKLRSQPHLNTQTFMPYLSWHNPKDHERDSVCLDNVLCPREIEVPVWFLILIIPSFLVFHFGFACTFFVHTLPRVKCVYVGGSVLVSIFLVGLFLGCNFILWNLWVWGSFVSNMWVHDHDQVDLNIWMRFWVKHVYMNGYDGWTWACQ